MNLDPTPSSPLRRVCGDCGPGVKRQGPFNIYIHINIMLSKSMSTVVNERRRNMEGLMPESN